MGPEQAGRLRGVQDRLLAQAPVLAGTILEEFYAIRRSLILASDSGQILNAPVDAYHLFVRYVAADGVHFEGGAIDRDRDGTPPHFKRWDTARLNFSILLADARPAQVLSYRFELALPAAPSFIRYDLDPPDGPHDDALRCHMHPGSDSIRVIAPVLTPLEMLDMLLYQTADA